MSFHPQTPQSPSRFSPATSSSDPSASLATSMASSMTTLPTPAHSVNGSSASQTDALMADESPHKRKRPLDETGGGPDPKKVHLDDRKLGIADLHQDVGHKYLLCQTPLPDTLPRSSQDLYEMFDLTSLAAEVAREKPNGEKNALRKTYKGHIKRLGVAGHFDVSKKNETDVSEFLSMLYVPELEWDVHEVKGKEIGSGLSETSLSALGRATTMLKGPVPKSLWDTSVLGDLASGGGPDGKLTSSAKPSAPNTPLTLPGTGPARSKFPGPPGQDPARPKRSIKKRSYEDSSFEGYAEGYPDDDAGGEGYSTGEGEGGQKRRKKPSATSSPFPSAMRQQSYGPGMVGA